MYRYEIKKHLQIMIELLSNEKQGIYFTWMLKNSKYFKKLKVHEPTAELKKLSRRSQARMCFINARALAIKHENLKYHEGYYCVNGIVLEHGFLVKDGKVFYPTAINNDFIQDITEWGGVYIPKEVLLKKRENPYQSYLNLLFKDKIQTLCKRN